DMEERIAEANLLDWEKILMGESKNNEWRINGLSQPFSTGDQIQVDTQLGMIVQSGEQPSEKDIEEVIALLPGDKDPKGKRVERIRDHIKNVLEPGPEGQQYRHEICNPTFKIISPVHHEEPKSVDQYSLPELFTFAKEHPKWMQFSNEVMQE